MLDAFGAGLEKTRDPLGRRVVGNAVRVGWSFGRGRHQSVAEGAVSARVTRMWPASLRTVLCCSHSAKGGRQGRIAAGASTTNTHVLDVVMLEDGLLPRNA